MAGGWNHSVEGTYDNPSVPKSGGKLLRNEDAVEMLENGGDWYEYAEEVYGMVWMLASMLSSTAEARGKSAAELIEYARENHQAGLAMSPGTDGKLPDEDE